MATITVNLNGMTWQEFNAFATFFRDGEFDKAIDIAKKVIVKWSYDVPVGDFDSLDLNESGEVIRTIFDMVAEVTNDPKLDGYAVSLETWKWRDFAKYQGFIKAGDIKNSEKMMVEVCTYNDKKLKSPLSFFDGFAFAQVVSKAISKALSGKN